MRASLRAAVDLEALGPVALNVDCDVLNADGGTRCASITAANIALRLAVRRLAQGVCLPVDLRPTAEERKEGWTAPTLNEIERTNHENTVIPHDSAAVSVGLVNGEVYLDLDYVLDSNADVDMNVIKTSDGKYVEVQGTGEESTFSADELTALLRAPTWDWTFCLHSKRKPWTVQSEAPVVVPTASVALASSAEGLIWRGRWPTLHGSVA